MEGDEQRRRRRKVGECSSVIIPIVLLNFSQKEKDRGRGNTRKKRYYLNLRRKKPNITTVLHLTSQNLDRWFRR